MDFFLVDAKCLTGVVGRIYNSSDCKFGLFPGHVNTALKKIALSLNLP
jgi:hypothetical protein